MARNSLPSIPSFESCWDVRCSTFPVRQIRENSWRTMRFPWLWYPSASSGVLSSTKSHSNSLMPPRWDWRLDLFFIFFFLLGGLTYSQVIPLVSLEIVLRTRQLDLHPVLNTKTFPLIEGTFSTFQQPVLVQCSNWQGCTKSEDWRTSYDIQLRQSYK